jgi:hypothetical protein
MRAVHKQAAQHSLRLFKTHFACFAPNTIGHNKWEIYRSARYNEKSTASSKKCVIYNAQL